MAPSPAALTRATGFADQTIREIVWASAGGQAARVHLSNTFGTRPVTFKRAGIAVSAAGPAIARGTSHWVRFGGHRSVTIQPGAEAVSDPVPMPVPAGTRLTVSLFTRGPTGPATYHSDAQQVNYVSGPGDHVGSRGGKAFVMRTRHWFFLDAVDVQAPAAAPGTIVAFGDSITDGVGSALSGNQRWPDDLARRMLTGPPGQVHPVVDEGIGGNRVLNDSPCFGTSALSRFVRDAVSRAGARYVILLEGINDIDLGHKAGRPCLGPASDPSAAQIIAGYQYLIAAAHAAGMKIFGATLTPFGGSGSDTPETEAKRLAVNRWIRTSGAFDGVIDFARAVCDPADPLRLRPAYDSGDHLHPNDAGYQAMADAINLAMFRR
ncbi:MAG TPA: SGNH/GDSL hydrolase family protein [Streptosporangiaceae bacterium]|jgi:lysophospholipase L1-like esterase|nr:SGNH/GDSL hydrolase family protein [Streptosporangiaceae bacterium]